MPAPTTHEDMVVGQRMGRLGTQAISLSSVLTVNTPLTPSESHEDSF